MLAGRPAPASAGSSRRRRRTSPAGRSATTRRPCSPSRPGWCDELTSGLTVTTRAAASGACPGQVEQGPAERGLGGGRCRAGCGRGPPARAGACRGRRRAAQPVGGRGAQLRPRRCRPANRAHGSAGSAPSRAASSRQLVVGQQRGVVLRVALDGQPVALDRVREDHRRPAVVDGRVGRRPARRGRGRRGCGPRRAARSSGTSGDQLGEPAAPRAVAGQRGPQLGRVAGAAAAGTRGWACRRSGRRSAPPPGRANSSSSSRPYLTVITCQPAAPNMPCSRAAPIVGTTRSSDCRFRSTTQTTSPSSATSGRATASQTAPSSSSASPSSEYWRPVPHRRRAEVPGDVPAGQRAPDRRGRADADRAGGVVDRIGVLEPARVALQAAELPAASSGTPRRAHRAGS